MFKVPTLSFKTGRCMSEQCLPDLLEYSRRRTNHLKSILHSLLQALEVTIPQHNQETSDVTKDKNLRD
jgi:hypothetical protein